MGVSGNSTSSGAQIQIELCTGDPDVNDGMRWRLYITSQGAYKLMAVTGITGGLVMTVDEGGLFPNGRKIKQVTYSNNANYADEWYIIDCDHIYGSQVHRVLDDDQRDDINCHGYAMLRDDWPDYVDYDGNGQDDDLNGDGIVDEDDQWCSRALTYRTMLFNNNVSVNDQIRSSISSKCKQDFEDWLTNEGYTWTYESTFSGNGSSNPLPDSQYRVVLRTGIEDVYFPLYGRDIPVFDYHFWYQTSDGQWSDKHGSEVEESLGAGITPFSTGTDGWDLGNWDDFYCGEIYAYIITVDQ